jgi:hypothetical protein
VVPLNPTTPVVRDLLALRADETEAFVKRENAEGNVFDVETSSNGLSFFHTNPPVFLARPQNSGWESRGN